MAVAQPGQVVTCGSCGVGVRVRRDGTLYPHNRRIHPHLFLRNDLEPCPGGEDRRAGGSPGESGGCACCQVYSRSGEAAEAECPRCGHQNQSHRGDRGYQAAR